MDTKGLSEEIEKIKERNKKVEMDKKWEICLTRRIIICLLTYLIVVLFSHSINKFSNIWLSSCIPVIGFLLSTLSLKFIRKVWEKNIK